MTTSKYLTSYLMPEVNVGWKVIPLMLYDHITELKFPGFHGIPVNIGFNFVLVKIMDT